MFLSQSFGCQKNKVSLLYYFLAISGWSLQGLLSSQASMNENFSFRAEFLQHHISKISYCVLFVDYFFQIFSICVVRAAKRFFSVFLLLFSYTITLSSQFILGVCSFLCCCRVFGIKTDLSKKSLYHSLLKSSTPSLPNTEHFEVLQNKLTLTTLRVLHSLRC